MIQRHVGLADLLPVSSHVTKCFILLESVLTARNKFELDNRHGTYDLIQRVCPLIQESGGRDRLVNAEKSWFFCRGCRVHHIHLLNRKAVHSCSTL